MKIKPAVSLVINVKNDAERLAKAIKSVGELAQEVIVVDMMSTDDSKATADKLGAQVYSHPDTGYVEPARQMALEKASGSWILLLDSDETITPELKAHLQEWVAKPSSDALFIPRQNWIFGKAAQGAWWPDYQLRFFRNGSVKWPNQLHAKPISHSTVSKLPPKAELAIQHDHYRTVEEFVTRALRYAKVTAQNDESQKNVLATALQEFLTRYYGWQGDSQETFGLHMAWLQAVAASFVPLLQWEEQGFKTLPNLNAANEFLSIIKQVRYWKRHRQWENSQGIIKLIHRLRLAMSRFI